MSAGERPERTATPEELAAERAKLDRAARLPRPDWLPAEDELAEAKATRERAQRADFTAGLRQLADALDAHPEAKLPYSGGPLAELLFQPKTAAEMDATAAALGCEWTPNIWDATQSGAEYFEMTGSLAGLKLKLLIERAKVGDAMDRLIDAARAHEATLNAQTGRSGG